MNNNPCTLEEAKELKKNGFNKTTNYYYQDIDLPYSSKGLKHSKTKINHNNFDDFIYSAPCKNNL